jgi:hypothetical protein
MVRNGRKPGKLHPLHWGRQTPTACEVWEHAAVSVNRTRSLLYSLARFPGDYRAVKRGRVGKRIANKVIGRSAPASGASRPRITNTRSGDRNRSSVLHRLLLPCVLVRGTLTPRHPSRENALATARRANGGGRPLGRRGLPPSCRASNGPLAAKAVVSERGPARERSDRPRRAAQRGRCVAATRRHHRGIDRTCSR